MSQEQALAIVNAHQGDKYSKICTAMAKDFNLVGRGFFGHVFDIGDDKVVKVYKACDRAYQTFQSVAGRLKCPHFPKFYYSDMGDHYHTVVMEKLTSFNCKTDMSHGMTMENMLERLNIQVGATEEDITLFDERDNSLPSSLINAAHAIRLLTGLYELDLRLCNVAQRDGILVFLDPLKPHAARSYKKAKLN